MAERYQSFLRALNTYMNKYKKQLCKGFTLIEALTVITISSLMILAAMDVYNRVQRSVQSVERKLKGSQLPQEVLQKIAEDIDRMVLPGSQTKITVETKTESHGFQTGRLEISNSIAFRTGPRQRDQQEEVFEKIIWQSSYDYEGEVGGMILYRHHSGLALEDKLLDEEKEDFERELFVPVCDELTYFSVQIPDGNDYIDSWQKKSLPKGVFITLSFAEPFRDLDGSLNVYDDEKYTRTIAVDRTRKIDFKLADFVIEGEANEWEMDVNDFEMEQENEQSESDANETMELDEKEK